MGWLDFVIRDSIHSNRRESKKNDVSELSRSKVVNKVTRLMLKIKGRALGQEVKTDSGLQGN